MSPASSGVDWSSDGEEQANEDEEGDWLPLKMDKLTNAAQQRIDELLRPVKRKRGRPKGSKTVRRQGDIDPACILQEGGARGSTE